MEPIHPPLRNVNDCVAFGDRYGKKRKAEEEEQEEEEQEEEQDHLSFLP